MKALTLEKFIERSDAKHGQRYIYSEYKNVYTKVKIICRAHGEFFQTPHQHMLKSGCPLCANEASKTWTHANEQFLKDNYVEKGAEFCSRRLNKTVPSIQHKAMRLGIKFPRMKAHFEIEPRFFRTIVKNALTREIPVNITVKNIWDLFTKQKKQCALTGWEVGFSKISGNTTASVDRINSQKPYSLDNIQIVHKEVNLAKRDFSQERFIEICKAVANNH